MTTVQKRSWHVYGEEVTCFLIVSLFMYASISKLVEYEKFQSQIGQSPILTAYSGFFVWFIPAIEILISVMLLVYRFRTIGFYAAFSLMMLFTAYIIAILNFADYIPCSCGGILSKMGWTEHLIFNIAFILLCIYGALVHHRNRSVTGQAEPAINKLQTN